VSEWENKSLAQFVTFQRGFDLPKSQFISGDIPVFGSTSILGHHNLSKVVAPGVITGRSGTLGKFQYSTVAFWPHNTTLWVKDFKGNDPKFSYYLMQCFDFSDFNGGGAVPTLNRNVLKSLKVDVPPLPTQQKIAKILSNYDDLIENNLKRIKLLEESARLTYEEWFLRFRIDGKKLDIDAESGLPFGWAYKKLGEICNVSSSKRIFLSDYVDDGIPFYRGKEITIKSLNNSVANKYFISHERFNKINAKFGSPEKNDILITAVGTLGSVYLVRKSDGSFYFKDGNLLWLKQFNNNESLYIYFSLKGDMLQANISGFAIGSSQKALTIQSLKSILVTYPANDILQYFNKIIQPLVFEIENIVEQNKLLKEARDILLPRLMTGMIDTDDMDIAI